ncbi:MAG: alpha/beta fold hydrolase [Oscillatoriophycideae cyanobacterium NC_groundwater_1537_Pr4_S-0.65um_50_18]|nr:alpha/beta fold hydrolase [Oscillatoriophycideae cyanobacterium NC_groundwater_1537_Pr4_S-0.65um_50_18]
MYLPPLVSGCDGQRPAPQGDRLHSPQKLRHKPKRAYPSGLNAPLLLFLSCVLTPLLGAPALAQSRPQAISGGVIECPMPLAPGEVEGKTVICGQIQVPENWSDPASPRIALTYMRQLSRNQSPIADPIIFFAGGPGGSVLASQGSQGFDFTYLRQTRDVIVWDQRGNRYSADLLCPESVRVPDRVEQEAAIAALGEPDFTLQSAPQAVLEHVRQLDLIIGTGRCAEYLKNQGRDLSQYNTVNTVQDAIALMDHLGYPAYNLFGISYGTQVTLAIMDYYETQPTAGLPPLRSAVIDGVFPINMTSAEEALVSPYNILRVFADCEADAACGQTYPNIRQRTIALLAQLEAAPIQAGRTTVTLDDVVKLFRAATSPSKTELVPYLPRLVDELSQGETATYTLAQGILSDQVTVEPTAPDAPNPSLLDPITLETAAVAAELRAIAARLDTLEQNTGALTTAIDEAKSLSELYLNVLSRYLTDAGPEVRGGLVSTVTDTYIGYPDKQTQDGLLALSADLGSTVGAELGAIAHQMSAAEVRTVWRTLTDDNALQPLNYFESLTNFVVKCNDRNAAFNTEPAFEIYRNFEAPQLIRELDLVASYQARCRIFELPEVDYAIAPPAVSDLPTLIMNGGIDHATAAEWGEYARAGLSNAQMITVPLTEHGTTRYSQCAKDIAHTFFLYPNAALDTSCVEEFRPVFVLPDDPLPAMGKAQSETLAEAS